MNNDPLDNEVSVSVEVKTPEGLLIGIKGKAKSRAISALDRLVGNLIAFPNAWLEAKPAKKRAETEAAVQAILGKNTQIDEPSIQAAVNNAVTQAICQQEKKILLTQEAIADLKQRPPNAKESGSGDEALDEGFLNRLEKRAEEATEKEIREKWSKVLAAEIRKPGIFSAKVMRIVDEVDKETAELFECLCQYRIGNVVPICLFKELNIPEQRSLERAELLISSENSFFVNSIGKNNINYSGKGGLEISIQNRIFSFSDEIYRISNYIEAEQNEKNNAPVKFSYDNNIIAYPRYHFPVYHLTPEGRALAEIFDNRQEEMCRNYLKKLSEFLPDVGIYEYKKISNNKVQLVQTWKNGKPLLQGENTESILS